MKSLCLSINIITAFFFMSASAQQIQNSRVSPVYKTPRGAVINVTEAQDDWYINLQLVEKANPEMNSNELQQIKSSIPTKKNVRYAQALQTENQPVSGKSFEGNKFHFRVPNDNDLAISNEGKIISVSNSIIYYFDTSGSLLDTISLERFASGMQMPEGKYDHRVIYDPLSDRFILVFLNGFDDSTSYILVAFSHSNDPLSDWNIYSLIGNPLNDTSWSDFPTIAINEHELFITLNLLKNGIDWKTGFKQTIVWQIDKSSGYNGDTLRSRLYSNINFKGKPLRNLCPVQGGSKPVGSEMYFMSNRNFSVSSDSFFVGKISGLITDTSLKLIMEYSKADQPYGVAPSADQPFSRLSETNDARVLDAFIENGVIHFAGNSINFDNNQATIYHGKLNISNPSVNNLYILKNADLEFGYPSLAYTGNSTSMDECILLFDHTSKTVNPGVSAMFYKNGGYSDIIRIKEGTSYVFVQSGKNQRWGDYTGLQRKYNEEGVAWGSAYFGKYDSSGYLKRVNTTWITQLISPTFSAIKPSTTFGADVVKTYPNPAKKYFEIEFNCTQTGIYNFSLYDANGKTIKLLLTQLVFAGKNNFSFSTDFLPEGIYILSINGQTGNFTNKIVIEK